MDWNHGERGPSLSRSRNGELVGKMNVSQHSSRPSVGAHYIKRLVL